MQTTAECFVTFVLSVNTTPPSARKGLGIQEGGMVEIAGCISHSPGCELSLWYDQRCLEDMSTITNQEPLQPQTILPNHPPPLSLPPPIPSHSKNFDSMTGML